MSSNSTTVSGINEKDAKDIAITSLSTSMTAAAFLGIAFYLCAELNIRLIMRSTRRSLYFWSCLVCSWAIIIHSIMITLADFKVWESYACIVIILFAWATFVNAQSVVLYSRLNLVLKQAKLTRGILYMIITNGVIFGLGSIVIALIARYPTYINKLGKANLVWDKIQVAAFFIQETIIGVLYIRATARHLKNMSLLGTDRKITRRVLYHLILVNIFIIILDCSLIGLCYSGYFFLQGFYKVAVYAVKLRAEFSILNQLRSSLTGAPSGQSNYGQSGYALSGNRPTQRPAQSSPPRNSSDSDVEMVNVAEQIRDITITKNITISSSPMREKESYELQEPPATAKQAGSFNS